MEFARICRRLLLAALAWLPLLAGSAHAHADDIREILKALLADYRTYGLPLPTKDARLALCEWPLQQPNIDWETTEKTRRHVAFVMQEKTKDRPAVTLSGCVQEELAGNAKLALIDPLPKYAKVMTRARNFLPHWYNELALAVQCQARGWDELAEAVLLQERSWCGRARDALTTQSVRGDLADMAVEHFRWQFVKRGTDRKMIAERLRAILDSTAEPSYWGREGTKELYDDLLETLKPSTAKPGSVESLIDALVDYRLSANGQYDQYDKLQAAGLRAMPALIRHVGDRRLTRSFQFELLSGKGRRGIQRVGGLVEAALAELTPEAEYESWWEDTDSDRVFNPKKAEAWSRVAEAMGEEEYLWKYVLKPKDEDGEILPAGGMLDLLAARYPKRVLELYHKALKLPNCQTDEIVDCLCKSKLPKDTKYEALIAAVGCPTLRHRLSAINGLEKLEHPRVRTYLVEVLQSIGKAQAISRGDVFTVVRVVERVEAPDAWEALLGLARSLKPVDRALLFEALEWGSVQGDPAADSRVEFLKSFVSDLDVIPQASLHDFDRHSNFEVRNLAVRDRAAYAIGRMLEMRSNLPKREWKADDWSRFRAKVEARCAEAKKKK